LLERSSMAKRGIPITLMFHAWLSYSTLLSWLRQSVISTSWSRRCFLSLQFSSVVAVNIILLSMAIDMS
jgi:hypothetical protein